MAHSVKVTLISAGIAIVVAIGVMFVMFSNRPNAASSADPKAGMNAVPPPPGEAVPSVEAPGQAAGFEVNPNVSGARAK